MNLFKSSSRKKIEHQIVHFTTLIDQIKVDKEKVIRDPNAYAKLWSIEKDYQRNIDLLREVL